MFASTSLFLQVLLFLLAMAEMSIEDGWVDLCKLAEPLSQINEVCCERQRVEKDITCLEREAAGDEKKQRAVQCLREIAGNPLSTVDPTTVVQNGTDSCGAVLTEFIRDTEPIAKEIDQLAAESFVEVASAAEQSAEGRDEAKNEFNEEFKSQTKSKDKDKGSAQRRLSGKRGGKRRRRKLLRASVAAVGTGVVAVGAIGVGLGVGTALVLGTAAAGVSLVCSDSSTIKADAETDANASEKDGGNFWNKVKAVFQRICGCVAETLQSVLKVLRWVKEALIVRSIHWVQSTLATAFNALIDAKETVKSTLKQVFDFVHSCFSQLF